MLTRLSHIPVLAMFLLMSCAQNETHTEPSAEPEQSNVDIKALKQIDLADSWTSYHTGEGSSKWRQVRFEDRDVIAQLQGGNPNKSFNICVNNDTLKNGEILVRFKAVRGFHDQGGGVVFRYVDENNHYIIRANPLEDNVVMYKMEEGVRSDLPVEGAGFSYGMKTEDLRFEWHTLKVKASDDTFIAYLDNNQLFTVVDSTFLLSGRIGLWTKADAITFFDSFRVTPAK